MKALITGVSGQDGSYLAEFLLEKGYEVHGIIRRTSFENGRMELFTDKIGNFHVHYGDLLDAQAIASIVKEVQPDEVYNLAAQSDVKVSFENPEYTTQVNAIGCLNVLEAVRQHCPIARFYQASTSEMFGNTPHTPQNEDTPFCPRSPYGFSKVCAYWATRNYREAYGLYAVSGILFNHESPRRGEKFVSRKITKAVANIKLGKQEKLVLGDLTPKRDWGHAKEYVKGMWLMLQQNVPEGAIPQDYVLATGETHSVEEFVDAAFKHVGLDWHDYVVQDKKFMRPSEVNLLLGDPTKAHEQLGWTHDTSFEQLVAEMVEADLEANQIN